MKKKKGLPSDVHVPEGDLVELAKQIRESRENMKKAAKSKEGLPLYVIDTVYIVRKVLN
jgi:hypothetical protein